jgi:hydroxymethylpyrimidine/phosphomethylpyrimidine kinase
MVENISLPPPMLTIVGLDPGRGAGIQISVGALSFGKSLLI